MNNCPLLPARLALLLLVLIGPPGMAEDSLPGRDGPHPDYQKISECVAAGSEVVLTADSVQCVPYGTGRNQLPRNAAYTTPARDVCKDPEDRRQLSADIIKKLAEKKDGKDAFKPSGIRIFGAVFCRQLDLVGLDLVSGLTLDRSFFVEGINARWFRTRGDLTLDQSVVLRNLLLYRAQIGGAVFATEAFVDNFNILEADIRGTIYLSDSLLGGNTRFDGAKIGGVSLRRSALSFLLIQFSQISGLLDLSQSEAQCAYHVRKNDLGELVAVNFGLGMATRRTGSDGKASIAYQWRRLHQQAEIRQMLLRPDITESVGKSASCDYATQRGEQVSKAEFVLFDNRVRSSLCLQAFNWLAIDPASSNLLGNDEKGSYLTLNYTTVGSHFILNLSPYATAGTAVPDPPNNRWLQAIGLEARSLILNFAEGVRPRNAFLDALRFERVLSGDVDCPYQQPDRLTPDRQHGAGYVKEGPADGKQASRPPSVKEILGLLNINKATTVQPFTAFIEAFDRAGQDALGLRVARADRDLEIQKESWSKQSTEGVLWYESIGKQLYFRIRDVWSLVADHGYQPVKAWWVIAGLLAVAATYFWGLIGVVGFESEKKQGIRPIGLLFLFDRLIPLYNIRQEHYQIKAFYCRTGWSASARKESSLAIQPSKTMTYLGMRLKVIEAGDKEGRWAGIFLDFLKAAGVLLAVFVVATVNALVTR